MATKPTATNNTTTSSSKTSKKIALSETLKHVPAAEGIARLRELDQAHGIIPASARASIEAALSRIEAVLLENAVTTLELATNPSRVLSILTGVAQNKVTQYHPTEVADRLHIYRNLTLAVAVLAADTIQADSPATSPAAIYSNSVKLARRSVHTRRPFADDEIVLCRVAAHLAALVDPRDQTATIYTYLDAGLVPGETTHVTIEDHDEPESPQHLLAAGNAQLAARFIQLDQFAAHTLTRHIDHALRARHSWTAPLTYTPRLRKDGTRHQPGSTSATASAQGTIDRFLEQLRLPTGDITASSITQWRVASTLASQGINAAWAVSGRTSVAAMYRALGTVSAQPVTRPDDDGESFAA